MIIVVLGRVHAPSSSVTGNDLRSKLAADPRFEVVVVQDTTNLEAVQNAIKNADMVVSHFYGLTDSTLNIYKSATRLKVIQTPWVGADHHNFTHAKNLGIKICNSRWNMPLIAEFTVSLLLACAKFIVPCHEEMRSSHKFNAQSRKSKTLRGSKVLFLGSGNIPRETIRLLEPFGIHATVLRRSASGNNESNVAEVSWNQYEQAAGVADFVICALPLTPETTEILDAKKFGQMKAGCVFINIGRAKVVHEASLYEALKSGHISNAALDVWYSFEKPYTMPFHELDNVILSPYRAFNADSEDSSVFWEAIIHNAYAIEEGRTGDIKNALDLEKGY